MTLHVAVLDLDFYLPACRSLKDKRRRLKRIGDRYGKNPNIAACESDFHDSHSRSRWSIVAVAGSARVVEQALTEVERWVAESIDATIVGVERSTLS